MKNNWSFLFSLSCGMLTVLVFSPFDYWFAGIPVLACIYFLMEGLTLRKAAWNGLFFGTGLFGAGASWVYVSIYKYGASGAPLAILLTSIFVFLLALLFTVPPLVLYQYLQQRLGKRVWLKPVLFASIWVLAEWSRSWVLTGFPWLITGYALISTPFKWLAPVTGVFGLSFLYVWFAASLAALWIGKFKAGRINFLLIIFLASCSWLLKFVHWTVPANLQPIKFSAVQSNIDQNIRWEPSHLQNIIRTYRTMTHPLWQQDLVIWPENALPVLQGQIPGLLEELDRQAEKSNTTLMLGLPWRQGDDYYNSFISLGAGNNAIYFKQKLVPFGEYVPFAGLLRGLINFFDLPMSSFKSGGEHQTMFQRDGAQIAAFICYEIVFPDFVARQAKNSNFLVTVSNDTWFGRSIGPFQHFQMARMRSLETGRYMIRATNDGITALIDPAGNILKSIVQYQSGILSGTVSHREGITPFMQLGSWPVLLLCLCFIITCWLPAPSLLIAGSPENKEITEL